MYSTHRYDAKITATRKDADREFRDALAVDNVGIIRRWVMWSGVRVGGWFAWRSDGGGYVDTSIAAEVHTVRFHLSNDEPPTNLKEFSS